MGLYFKSLVSSSSGNSVALWTENSRILVDCGLGSMKRTRAAMATLDPAVKTDGVLITHVHSDHVSFYPLRVLEQECLPVWVHEGSLRLLRQRHFQGGYGFKDLDLRTFDSNAFQAGDFTVQPIAVEHHPYFETFGFALTCRTAGRECRVVIATDFCRWDNVADHCVDADFLFVESNHDLELLARYFNPNSRYHMPNPQTAKMLCEVRRRSRRRIQSVMLGHISSQRNKPAIALAETHGAFEREGLDLDFELLAAPLREPSETITILAD